MSCGGGPGVFGANSQLFGRDYQADARQRIPLSHPARNVSAGRGAASRLDQGAIEGSGGRVRRFSL